MSDRTRQRRAGKMKGEGVSRMAEGERDGKLPTKGSGRQSSKTHGECICVCHVCLSNNMVRECKQ